ncbi:unnamed protein product [Candida verbasci]|uniref:SSD domain-containing protein n=1 Tax=Candida verbasci TaxID=1227364 RepID=A0A9W4X9F0_9ASCO|nr:unnamed protein product [Candida verbasci]
MLIFNLLLLFYTSLTLAISTNDQHKEGYCNQLNNCGKKSIFGKPLPCATFEPAIKISPESKQKLNKICGDSFNFEYVCCSDEQIDDLKSNLKRVDPIISSCPACHQNFYSFFCQFSCSPNQSKFVEILKTQESKDLKKEIITEINQYVSPKMAKEFFNSCKNVKFSATNGYAMDLIGGGAKNYSQFLKFLGDEKPLLGGSPYQINFVYEEKENLELRDQKVYPCNDEKYSCACTDCESACPELPKIRNLNKKCTVGGLPCFSFTILVIWICFIIILGGYHIYIANTAKSRHNSVADDDLDTMISPLSYVTMKKSIKRNSEIFNDYLEDVFSKIGRFCSSFPGITIGSTLFISFLLCLGLSKLQIETDPINLWVSPNEPAYKNQQYFEKNFGKWYRIEQIIISSKDDSPVLNWDLVKWWFKKESELENISNVKLSDICFKPLGETCAIESFTQYFNGDINQLTESNWSNKLQKCVDSPVECLPSFQQPLKSNILFDNDDVTKSRAFIITLLVNNDDEKLAIEYENHLQSWIQTLKHENLHISYSTEISLTQELNDSSNTDIKTIAISYLVMFIYSSFALGGRLPNKISSLIKTRFLLGLSGIFIILLSVVTSVGFFSLIGLKSTLIIAEVIPFLLLAIGIDNTYLIVHELKRTEGDSIEDRISKTLGKMGPSCFISSLLQFCMFLLATVVDMPAVRNFAFYSAGAILINFILQMTCFIGFLALDQRRLEDNRIDCVPFIQISSIKLPEDDEEICDNDNDDEIPKESTSGKFATFIIKYKRRILTLFVLWLGISLILLPNINYGLDQRIALPRNSYLIDYFNSMYEYFNAGPPVFYVVKDLDLLNRTNQQKLCGKFSGCDKYSLANILEQEFKRSKKSMINEPTSNWLDDFFTWLNPDLDQCCRLKKSNLNEFCLPSSPDRQCQTCYFNKSYDTSMDIFPKDSDFMFYFNQWIQEPSDPCPLGGKAPYSTSISRNSTDIISSYFRTSHVPLKSQDDFINGYKNSIRIIEEIKKYTNLDIFPWSPFYIFFVQYLNILSLTVSLLSIALFIIFIISYLVFGTFKSSFAMTITILSILINIGGVLSIWNISLNALSLVNLLIICGICVEFTIHITKRYSQMVINDDEFYANYSNEITSTIRDARIIKTMKQLSGSIITGIIITKFIGISILAFTSSKIFEIYYFRMYFTLITVASLHALVLLPILLSL